jgi:hypothetical protein
LLDFVGDFELFFVVSGNERQQATEEPFVRFGVFLCFGGQRSTNFIKAEEFFFA